MRLPSSALPLLAGLGLALSLSAPTHAEKPSWVPIAELLVGSIGQADPLRMVDVMSRCTALNLTLAGLAESVSAESASLYRNEADRLIEEGLLIESQAEEDATGKEVDVEVLSRTVVARVQGMVDGYGEWLDDNMETGDSYFDRGLELEISSCQLVSRMVNQMRAG